MEKFKRGGGAAAYPSQWSRDPTCLLDQELQILANACVVISGIAAVLIFTVQLNMKNRLSIAVL